MNGRNMMHRAHPPRVVLVISNLEYGGAQRQVIELVNHMDRNRFDMHICSLSEYVPLASGLTESERRLHIIPKRHKFDISTVYRLQGLLRQLRADVVHGYLFNAQIASRLAGRLAGTPLVVGSERNTDYTLMRRHLVTFRLTRSCVDVVIANSNAGAMFNQQLLGLAPSQYHVVHNGVNTDRFRPMDASALRRELGLRDNEPVVGMFASYKPQKNHPLFFAAARRVLRDVPNARFMAVGDALHGGLRDTDTYKCSIVEMVDALGIRDRCLFVENRPDPERLYPVCDVTVLPSFHEGTPNVLLESMAAGVPVVATDVSDNRYVVPEGRAGYVVPLGDEEALADRLRRLLTDASLRRRMGCDARRWVEEEFSSRRLADKTAQVYRAGLQHKSNRAFVRAERLPNRTSS